MKLSPTVSENSSSLDSSRCCCCILFPLETHSVICCGNHIWCFWKLRLLYCRMMYLDLQEFSPSFSEYFLCFHNVPGTFLGTLHLFFFFPQTVTWEVHNYVNFILINFIFKCYILFNRCNTFLCDFFLLNYWKGCLCLICNHEKN